jgi:glycerol-3-phosphate dehydrogenase
MIRGTRLPLAAVDFVVQEEWARSLDDVIDRRLMLAFDPGLCRGALEDVATVLADLGRLPRADVDRAAAACGARLAARHDRRLSTNFGSD